MMVNVREVGEVGVKRRGWFCGVGWVGGCGGVEE